MAEPFLTLSMGPSLERTKSSSPPEAVSREPSVVSSDDDSVDHLSDLRINELRRMPEKTVQLQEARGYLYARTFRVLQIRPERYEPFYEGVIRVVRRKSLVEIKRGTGPSFRLVTTRVLRGFGKLIWHVDSPWVLNENELPEGETRAIFIKGAMNGENDWFFSVFEPLWRKMRNLLFEPKPIELRGRKTRGRRQRLTNASPDMNHHEFDAENSDFTDDLDHNPLDDVQYGSMDEPTAPDSLMTETETDTKILKLITDLSYIRAYSRPDVFEKLWEQHVARLEEFENSIPNSDQEADGEAEIQTNTLDLFDHPQISRLPTNLSNSPFNEKGFPSSADSPLPVVLAPSIPKTMAVYITTATSNLVALQTTTRAYAWPTAPVQVQDMSAFLDGVDLRVSIRSDHVLGWILSYGWNDMCRFIFNDVARPNTESDARAKRGVTFEDWQYRRIGWSTFQSDVRKAALQGVRVWRMKVCVVESKQQL